MKYNYEFDMKYTENPYIDIIVNCVKILGMNAVVKNENEAMHYEDVRSARLAANFLKWYDGHWNEKDGPYNEYTYMEWNSYYRMLNGLPPAYSLNDEMAYLQATGKTENDDDVYEDIGNAFVIPELYKRYFIDMSQYELPDDMKSIIDLKGRYLHELSIEELGAIETSGIMKQIFQEYGSDPHYQYIYHLGDKKIDFYTSRTADNFSLLWVPQLNTFDIIEQKFRRVFDRNRTYTIATVYSEAYRFMSYHYDAFIVILIIIQTMVDMISEVQEYIINKDVFDSRTIRYLFESYGIAYYKEIPVKYQIRIIKNVNTLLKYKSSHRNITDILELFDNTNISIYTYYLMKTKKLSRDEFFYYTEKDVNPKYGTRRKYWLGNPSDINNNRVPLTNVKYDVDDSEFIRQYIYNYYLPLNKKDITNNRILTRNDQMISSQLARQLESVEQLMPINSFLDGYMRSESVNWFNISEYTTDNIPQKIRYLANRSEFLSNFEYAMTKKIKRYMDSFCRNYSWFALNQYHCRRIKYAIYACLGIYDESIIYRDDFDELSDNELEQYFYQVDTVIPYNYRISHPEIGIDTYGEDSEDKYILHHTIPFMVYFSYRGEDGEIDRPSYIFQNNQSFSINAASYPDSYDKWTKAYRRSYIIAVRSIIEGLFDSLNITESNPTPRYFGWLDVNYATSQLKKTIEDIEIGDEITTEKDDKIPIYNFSFISDVVTEDMVGQEYFKKNYNLAFLKVPILSANAYEMLERYDMRRNYDAITLADPFWDGVTTFDILTDEERAKLHETKKNEILSKDFTIERTKYIGVEAAINLTKISYQICYFMNMLYDKHKDEEELYIDISTEITESGRVRLNDILTFATALNYMYQGIEPDIITSDMEKNMYINGFNFDTDWTDIYNYLQNQHHIYNNYNSKPDKDYTYTDEFGESHTVIDGYGMDSMMSGWRTELYDDFKVYDVEQDIKSYIGFPSDEVNPDTGEPVNKRIYMDNIGNIHDGRVGAFLSGRYEQCPDNCIITEKYNIDYGYSDIWKYNFVNHVKYDWYTDTFNIIDISWRPTHYPNDDNNSHAMWMTTKILNSMNDPTISDLDKIDMLKKIYYNNTNLYEHLTYMMRTAESKRMYDIYKVLFDSFMETKFTNDFFKLTDYNGKQIYINENDPSSQYNIIYKEYHVIDENGFPYFDLIDMKTDEKLRYRFIYNDNFTDCKYICNETGDVVNCIQNATGNYEVSDDYSDEFKRGYMYPNGSLSGKDNKIFVLATNNYYMLQDINNTDILIPVVLNDDGTIKLFLIGDTPIPGDNGGIIHVEQDEDGTVNVIITYNNKEPIDISLKIGSKTANDYYEYMKYRNIDLYNHMINIKYNYANVYNETSGTYIPSDEKRQKIESLCEQIVIALEKYFDKEEWKGIFNIIPTSNVKNIQNYIMKMVVFFKSWKAQIIDTSMSYLIDDPYNNHVQILDDLYYNTTFNNLLEKVSPRDYKYFLNTVKYNDTVCIRDKVVIEPFYVDDETYWVTFGFGEKIYGHKFDYVQFKINTSYNDSINIREKISIDIVDYNGEVTQDENGNYLFP